MSENLPPETEAQDETLVETLQLERIEENLFRGTSPDNAPGRIFGGQVIAQSLLAAYETVEARVCHSLHCYFIRPGDPTVPIVFEVDRSRDGGSFTTRRVGSELKDQREVMLELMKDAPEQAKRWLSRPMPIEMRSKDARTYWMDKQPKPPESQNWFRCATPIGDDPRMHQVILAYASDMNLLSTAMRPHGVHWQTKGFQSASLDHAMWFHKPTNFNDWHLYVHDSPSASDGRGLIRGAIYAEDGTLVASVAQEGLLRMRSQ